MITKLKRGLFIAIEGIDGSGKSTLARTLATQFEKKGIPTLLTREPGGSQLGKSLRAILQHQEKPLSPIGEFLLFAADRAQHFQEVIIPALDEKKLVISDRLSDSSIVYQGFGKGVDRTMIAQVNQWAMQNIKPDLVIYVRIDAQTAHERLISRGKKLTSFEQQANEFTQRLIDGFETLYANAKNVIIVDSKLAPNELATFTFNQINLWLTSNPRITDSAKS
ncbi:MAG TPA: dTMP kinase [Candidatus Babeliales bacterium]|nr:dTMP kinase [Candidatus Babeliales bacterium]